MKRRSIVIVAATAVLAVSCSSGPKVAKNPAEEAALQAKAQKVIAAGQTESAKNGGYDATLFWRDRGGVTDKYSSRVTKQGIFSRSKKMYIMDFKVKFVRELNLAPKGGKGGMSFFDKLAERSKTTYGLAERRYYVGQVKMDDAAMQKIADAIYADFKSRMTSLGYELIARENISYDDLKEYLADGDKMIASPQDGEKTRVFAPTGWKLEKSTYDTATLGAAFGDNLIKLGEQVSRKIDDGIAVAPTYVVTFGGGRDGQFAPYLNVAATVQTAQKYTFGGAEFSEKPIQDAVAYKVSEENKGVVNTSGKTMAAITSALTQTSQEFSSTELHEIHPDAESFKSRLMEHVGYLNDLIEEHVREGRDD